MGIDWITFGAQLVNLAILVVLLYKFLYKPMLNAIDGREARIASEIKMSRDLAVEAEKRLEELNQKHADFDAQRQQILQQAHRVAEELQARLEREIRADAVETRLFWKQELEQEKKSLATELRGIIVLNFTQFARKALKELADIKLEAQIIEMLKRRFFELPEEEKERLIPKEGETPVVYVYTAKELGEETQEELGSLLDATLQLSQAPILFEVNPHLLCGVEISVNGNVLSWNLDTYLKDFTDNMHKALDNISLRLSRESN